MKPGYKLVHDKELYFLDNAHKLFAKDRAKGDGTESAKEKVRRWQAKGDISIDDSDEMQMNTENSFDQIDSFSNFNAPSLIDNASSIARQSKETSKGTKRKSSDIIVVVIMEVTKSMKEIARAITNSSKCIIQQLKLQLN
ncbi:hypothetical protein JCGZ_08276 [Jatropha curcas]|uniref:Uncharacterized protein n=1 Tax=Jatropha curcas TaxID=180498 RepID=A0A067KYU5_JATCU|nr:hypothetical protein JCGZ_08276 [Jatropha curcas]